MQLTISGHHVDQTDALRDYVGTQLQRLQRHSDQIKSPKSKSPSLLRKRFKRQKPLFTSQALTFLRLQNLMICIQRLIYWQTNSIGK